MTTETLMRAANLTLGACGVLFILSMWACCILFFSAITDACGMEVTLLAAVVFAAVNLLIGLASGDNIGRALFGRDSDQ